MALIFWLSFVLQDPKFSPYTSFPLHTQLPKGASPFLPFITYPSTDEAEATNLKNCPFKLHGTFKPLQCSPCSNLQEHQELERSCTGIWVFFHFIYNYFEVQTFSVFKSWQRCGLRVVLFLPLLCSVLFTEEVLGSGKEGSHYYLQPPGSLNSLLF